VRTINAKDSVSSEQSLIEVRPRNYEPSSSGRVASRKPTFATKSKRKEWKGRLFKLWPRGRGKEQKSPEHVTGQSFYQESTASDYPTRHDERMSLDVRSCDSSQAVSDAILDSASRHTRRRSSNLSECNTDNDGDLSRMMKLGLESSTTASSEVSYSSISYFGSTLDFNDPFFGGVAEILPSDCDSLCRYNDPVLK